MPHHLIQHHIYSLKNNFENSTKNYYISLRVINLSICRHVISTHEISHFSIEKKYECRHVISPHVISHFSIKKKYEYKKYPLNIIYVEFSQHVDMLHHIITHHLYSIKNNSKNSRKNIITH
jgi:hypothetical protein